MDSQENALNQGTEEVKLSEEVAANATTENSEVQNVNTDAVEENLNQPVETKSESEKENLATKTYSSKKEIIERLKAIVDSNETPEKAEVEHLKRYSTSCILLNAKHSRKLISRMAVTQRNTKYCLMRMKKSSRQR